jgi:NSS family neurotransmitter:Na+ symporter
LAIFPIVFAYGLNPQEGPGLVFVTLTTAFSQMTGGQYIGGLFFLLVFVAALTSAFSMMEVMVSRAEEIPGRSRKVMSSLIGLAILITGLGTVFSFNIWRDFFPLDFIPVFSDKTVFGIIDFVITAILLPVGAMGYAIFAGWYMSNKTTMDVLGLQSGWQYSTWLMLTRFITPIAILAVFFYKIYG